MFGDQNARCREILEKIVYSKTLEWKHEQEYRLAIPLRAGEDWTTLAYHPEEVSELYLGTGITADARNEIVALARKLNSQIEIFQTVRHADRSISFDDYTS
jgi:hypothetical protein